MIKIGVTEKHGIMDEIMHHPPRGIRYSLIKPRKNPILTGTLQYFESKRHHLIEAFDFPCVTKNNWIYDCYQFNAAAAFTLCNEYFSRDIRLKLITKLFLKNNFKKLVFGSLDAKKNMYDYGNITNKQIINKTEVVYPAIRKINNKFLNKKNDKTNILFLGRDFILKGGIQLINVFERLQNKFDNLKLTIISNFYEVDSQFDPLNQKNILKKRIENNPNIVLTGKLRRNLVLKKYYPKADIFVLPTISDAFGFSLLEAQAFGLPIVSTNQHAIPEIIENEKSGLLIDIKNNKFYNDPNKFKNNNDKYLIPKDLNDKLTNGIYDNLKRLIEDDSLRKRLGRNAIFNARTKFSFEKRNKIMKKIYEEAAG